MTPLFVGVLAYVAFQLVIGFAVSRMIRTEEDYLLAGRRLGPVLATASIFATWFGAETCVGAAGEVYAHGFGTVASDPFGYGICLVAVGLFLAGPLWRRQVTTLADVFRTRFSIPVEKAVAVMLVPGSVIWAAAQVRAFGHLLANASTFSPTVGMTIAALVVVVYTVSGGLLADAVTDIVQGVVLIAGLVFLFAVVVANNGGLSAITDALASAPASPDVSLFDTVNAWAVPILGSLLAQEVLARVFAARSERVATRATLGGAMIYIVVGCIPVLLGAIGAKVVPGLDDGEQVLAALASRYLGSFGFVVLVGALVSAILSTVDSALLVAASFVSHNLVAPLVPAITDRGKVLAARVAVVVFGGVAYVLALVGGSVHDLVLESSSFGSSGVLVAGLFGIFTRVGGAPSAFAALIGGTGTYLVASFVFHADAAFLTSLGVALVAYLALSRLGSGQAGGASTAANGSGSTA